MHAFTKHVPGAARYETLPTHHRRGAECL